MKVVDHFVFFESFSMASPSDQFAPVNFSKNDDFFGIEFSNQPQILPQIILKQNLLGAICDKIKE